MVKFVSEIVVEFLLLKNYKIIEEEGCYYNFSFDFWTQLV